MDLFVQFLTATLGHWWPVVLIILVGTGCIVVLEFEK